MITFQHIGRLGRFGNQLFQYATLYGIAKHNNYEFGIPYKNRNFKNDYMDLCISDCFANLSAKDSSSCFPLCFMQENENKFLPNFLNINDGCDIYGYFQTEKYFKKYRNDLLKEFKFSETILNKVQNIKNKIGKDTISIHMRYGDYEKFSNIYPRPKKEYYENALNFLPKNIPILLFSDEPQKALNYLKEIKINAIHISDLNKYEDMCLMSLCDYHIITNSSFSWWGSWLSNSKQTIAPKEWYGNDINAPKFWNDIYCEDWKIL